MRAQILSLALAATLCAAAPAWAAPECETRAGDTIKCGIPGAMAVGWRLPREEWLDPPPWTADEWMRLAGGLLAVISLFVLIGSLPEFDGRHDSDWGEQEGDGNDPRR